MILIFGSWFVTVGVGVNLFTEGERGSVCAGSIISLSLFYFALIYLEYTIYWDWKKMMTQENIGPIEKYRFRGFQRGKEVRIGKIVFNCEEFKIGKKGIWAEFNYKSTQNLLSSNHEKKGFDQIDAIYPVRRAGKDNIFLFVETVDLKTAILGSMHHKFDEYTEVLKDSMGDEWSKKFIDIQQNLGSKHHAHRI
jgi:hypothetical protein